MVAAIKIPGGPDRARRGPGSRSATFSRRPRVAACAVLLAGLICNVASLLRAQAPQSGQKGPAPLVKVDEELAGYLAEAERLIDSGNHTGGVEILQALLNHPSGVFAPAGDGRFVPLGDKVNQTIAAMPPEALALYRRLYDPEAKALYQRAARSRDVSAYCAVAGRYLHTSWAPAALEDLGAIHYDSGEFRRAASCWRRAAELPGPAERHARLLAGIAAAYHQAGDEKKARAVAAELKKRFPRTTCLIAGRRRNAAAFTERALKAPCPGRPSGPPVTEEYPGLGGLPDGLGLMSECDVILAPQWPRPKSEEPELIAAAALKSGETSLRPRMRDGHVSVYRSRGGVAKRFLAPAMVHPVVVGETIVYRTDSGIEARDLLSGRRLTWAKGGFPLLEDRDEERSYYGYRSARPVGDFGEYMLTVGGGKIFVRHGFAPFIGCAGPWGLFGLGGGGENEAQGASALTAIDVGDSRGRSVWRIGKGKGQNDILKAGRYVSAPTYAGGRLFVIVLHAQWYYAVCLDARDGSAVWERPICQIPSAPAEWAPISAWPTARCSPPAVADGRAFALPNVGVVVAMDAETGRPLWAVEYPSSLRRSPSDDGGWAYGSPSESERPVNPVIVTADRVICLPADSDSVVALTADDGRPAWPGRVSRRGQSDLSAVGAGRLLLSGPGLVVLSAEDGRQLAAPEEAKAILGRPAVTPSEVLASGRGRLYRLALETYELSEIPLTAAGGLLGNLLSTRGVLIAANSAGVCAYLGYEDALARVEKRLGEARPRERADLLLSRSLMAYSAGKFEDALRDALLSKEAAVGTDSAELAAEAMTWACRAQVALANLAPAGTEMVAAFEKAEQMAATPEQQAHVKLRLSKSYEKAGRFAAAVAKAREISDRFAELKVADVPIGPEAGKLDFEQHAERVRGRRLGQEFIAALIRRHGQSVYAEFDVQAAEVFEAARASGDSDAMRSVFRRWPNSVWADDAMYAAAEKDYVRARKMSGEAADEVFGKVITSLSDLAAVRRSPLSVQANAALAAIYARSGSRLAARLMADRVRDEPEETPIKFADIDGTLGEILEGVRTGELPIVREKDDGP